MLVKRERYLRKIRPYYDADLIKVLTGIRRCGKSMLLKQIENEFVDNGFPKDHIIRVNFEDFEFESIRNNSMLNKYVKRHIKDENKYLIFLDEIQHVKDFEKILASFKATLNCSIFVTGSNSKILSGNLATLLVGRCIEFKIMPFSFEEAVEYATINNIDIKIDEYFEDYLKWGGMPQRFAFNSEDNVREYLEHTYNSIIEKDVIQGKSKLNKEKFVKLSSYVMANAGKEFSSSNIERFFEINNNETFNQRYVYRYLDKMEKACLIDRVKRFDIVGKKSLSYIEKQYAADNGFRTINTNLIKIDITFFLENLIYNELVSRGYKVFVGKTQRGEIDFVVIEGRKKCFIQVAYLLASEDVIKREFNAFKPISDASPKYVLSLDKFDFSRDGIAHINIIDFLLGKTNLYLS